MHQPLIYRLALCGLCVLGSGCSSLKPGWDWDDPAAGAATLPARTAATIAVPTQPPPTPQEMTCHDTAWRSSFADMSARDLIYAQTYRICMGESVATTSRPPMPSAGSPVTTPLAPRGRLPPKAYRN